MKLRFVTLMPECGNTELVKDVGQIPFVLGQEYEDIVTSIVACNIKKDGVNISNVGGLNIVYLKKFLNSTSLTGLVYILFNSKKCDWLNIYHAGRCSYYWTKLYKLLNPKGKVYLKLDLDYRSCDTYDADIRERRIFYKNTRIVDLITVETKSVKDRIQKYSYREIKLLGNGFCKSKFKPNIFQERQDTFVTVGRLGTKQKATEILLEAFAKSASFHSWNLKLIGSIEDDFKNTINRFYLTYPELKERVTFTGEIKERQALYEEYCSSKVFVLASRWEGFPIVGGEALSCGCRIIISNQVPSAMEITRDQKYGQIVPAEDVNALSRAIISETTRHTSNDELIEIKEYADKYFSWSSICNSLYMMLKNQ